MRFYNKRLAPDIVTGEKKIECQGYRSLVGNLAMQDVEIRNAFVR
jgi:hypothetical protein